MSASMLPLHIPITKEFDHLSVQHMYSMMPMDFRDAKISFNGDTMTVKKYAVGQSSEVTHTFCNKSCVSIDLPDEDLLIVSIHHGCVDGWRMVIKSSERDKMSNFKDAILRWKNDVIASFNVLLPYRCKKLKIFTPVTLSREDCVKIADATIPDLPCGTSEKFKGAKTLAMAIRVRVVNRCPAMTSTTSSNELIRALTVKDGVITLSLLSDDEIKIYAILFHPPRLATPDDSPFVLYVCEAKTHKNPRLAWVFESSPEHAPRMLETLQHAWMLFDEDEDDEDEAVKDEEYEKEDEADKDDAPEAQKKEDENT